MSKLDTVDTEEVAQKYFVVLGGNVNKYDPNTTDRIFRFAKELCVKRAYEKFTTFKTDSDEMILANHLRLFSFCEHHLLPFHGYVSIGYIPNGKILGLSKLARVVEKIASKPQIQERLTTDILKFIDYLIAPKGTGVQVKATHTCVMWRGVQSSEAEFTTTALSGNFKDNPQTRHEFLMGIAH